MISVLLNLTAMKFVKTFASFTTAIRSDTGLDESLVYGLHRREDMCPSISVPFRCTTIPKHS